MSFSHRLVLLFVGAFLLVSVKQGLGGCTPKPKTKEDAGPVLLCDNDEGCPPNHRCEDGYCVYHPPEKKPVPPDKKNCSKKEVCNGQDDNCDGVVDNVPGRSTPLQEKCYTGPWGTAGVGACRQGSRTCRQGNWPACTGEKLPQSEVCGDGQDNDCDGSVDNGCPCTAGEPSRDCYPGPIESLSQGICKSGKQSCQGGFWSSCEGAVLPKEEECDGQDNDCDGQIDEGLSQPCYTGPAKSEGVGICKGGTQLCQNGRWGACMGEVTPSSVEICNDKLDNNCNGLIDEYPPCNCKTPGAVRPCYSGPVVTRGVGLCQAGLQTCTQGEWGPCQGEVTPTQETCDRRDNDCNGLVDDMPPRVCYLGPQGTQGKGICRPGFQECINGTWQSCQQQVLPQKEICDSRDNDCNGQVDEGCPCKQGQTQSCYSGPPGTRGVGRCRAGKQTCNHVGKHWNACQGAVLPSQESCNNQDDDCDGKIDEGLRRSCYSGPRGTKGVGVCQAGFQVCSKGKWGACLKEVKPSKEICDGKDNDCDGKDDEDIQPALGSSCSVGKGICRRSGKYVCKSDHSGTTCDAKPGSPRKEICDRKDNDCDGQTDEGCQCVDGTDQVCYSGATGTAGQGECKKGKQICSGGKWGSCSGQVTPQQEMCDGKDNDCDGSTDEGLTRSCYSGTPGTSGQGPCKEGTQECKSGQWGSCNGEVTPQQEMCDGKDNNCDGQIDETFQKKGQPCTVGKGECENKGIYQCTSDGKSLTCSATAGTPSTEKCDGKDNDCDGSIDEDFNVGTECFEGEGECKKKGNYVCKFDGSGVTCDATAGTPSTEKCDGKDNDCDGSIDEDFPDLDKACSAGIGECENRGKKVCKSDGSGTECNATAGTPATEVCDDGKDNDCDGKTDCADTEDCEGKGCRGGTCKQGNCKS